MRLTCATGRTIMLTAALCLLGCGGDDEEDAGAGTAGGPAAPSNMQLELMGAGIHVIWKDNAVDEQDFVVERHTGDGKFEEVVTVDFEPGSGNEADYHDEPLAPATYTYRVGARNAQGTAYSSPASLARP
jgi:hypothetical protein